MKAIALRTKAYIPAAYPNAASNQHILHKVLDFLLITASCAGIAAMLLLLAVLA